MSANTPAELPNIADARLPATYESAKRALAECSRIDECQNWADKAAALASYARQAHDDTLFNLATRIKARALDRCGELLRQIPASSGGRPQTKDGADLSLTPRQQAAHDAHLSERQRKTALRINNIPRERFEALVESEHPPTATQLAEMGKEKRRLPLRDRDSHSAEEFAAASALMEIIEDFVRASASIDIPLALSQCEKAELQRLLPSVRLAGEWLIDLLGDASDRLVGCGSERISGGEPIVGQRDVEDVFDGIEPERASKPNALNEALITAPQPEREELPTLDPRAWSMSTAQQREVFVKAVGRSAIEDAFNSIESGYTLTRGLNTLNQAWCAATESDRRTFYRQLFPANIFNRFQA